MIIHSIIAADDIFCKNNIASPLFKNINGGILELENSGGQLLVKKLFSTDPKLYLDKRYSPYTQINGQ